MANKIIMTDGTRTETVYKVKSINPYTDETPGVWSPDSNKADAKSVRLVPSVFAGITARMQAMGDLPFTIYNVKGDQAVDDSDNYQNIVGFMPYPHSVFALTEGSLVVKGGAYWERGTGTSTGKLKALKYWIPSSVTLDPENAKKGNIMFRRQGVPQLFPAEKVLYFWLLDPETELGAPSIYPLASAMTVAEANGAISKWVRDYMTRGAIKAMLLAVDGNPPAGEVERMESWFNKFMSGLRGLTWKVFNMASVKPTIIGEGLEALKDLSITKDLRYEIHEALGTRHLLEDENYATAEARERQFYTQTVVPDARIIQNGLNEQILHNMGYHLEFEPGRLEIFQQNESEQAQAFATLYGVLSEALSAEAAFRLASDMLNIEFTEEQQKLIDNGLAEKQKAREEVQANINTRGQETGNNQPPQNDTQQDNQPPPDNTSKAIMELDKWEQKVSKAGKMITWHAVYLSRDIVKAIVNKEMTFEEARKFIGQSSSDAASVLEGIRLALKLMEKNSDEVTA